MTTLQKRILSALVLGPIVIAAVWIGSWAFYILMAAVFGISVQEWSRLSLRDGRIRWPLLAVGVVYVFVACFSALWLRGYEAYGIYLLLYVMFAIWACDSGAYASGKMIGGPKMAPAISPNKTWAGLVGGCVASALAVVGLMAVCKSNSSVAGVTDEQLQAMMAEWPRLVLMPYAVHFIIGVFLAVIGQIGDLMISLLKRRCGLKDTGNIIPGHGGLLDRIDALLLALPIFAAIVFALEHFK